MDVLLRLLEGMMTVRASIVGLAMLSAFGFLGLDGGMLKSSQEGNGRQRGRMWRGALAWVFVHAR